MRSQVRRLWLIVLLTVLVSTPFVMPANSLPQSVLKSIPLARIYWGLQPCGKLRVVVTPLRLAPTPPGGLSNAGYAIPARCLIVLDPDYVTEMPDWMICELVLHEYGHITGHGHVSDVRKIMHRQLGRHHYPCRSRVGQ